MDFTVDFWLFLCVTLMYCLKLLLILNFTNTVVSKRPPSEAFLCFMMVSYGSKKGKQTPPPPLLQEIHSLGPMDLTPKLSLRLPSLLDPG
jgi:hypothetical protein